MYIYIYIHIYVYIHTHIHNTGTGLRGKHVASFLRRHLFESLPHYSWRTRARHLFLATGDIKDLPVEIQGQPLLISLGASFCGGHIAPGIMCRAPKSTPVHNVFRELLLFSMAPPVHLTMTMNLLICLPNYLSTSLFRLPSVCRCCILVFL